MKRIIYTIFLIFCVFLHSTFSVFASSTTSNSEDELNISGYDNWSFEDKVAFWVAELPTILGACGGLFLDRNAMSFKSTVEDVYRDMEFRETLIN